jgi:hypothetical protein
MIAAPSLALTFVCGLFILCGLVLIFLASMAQLEEVETLMQLTTIIKRDVKYLSRQLDYSIIRLQAAWEIIHSTPYTPTQAYLRIDQSS